MPCDMYPAGDYSHPVVCGPRACARITWYHALFPGRSNTINVVGKREAILYQCACAHCVFITHAIMRVHINVATQCATSPPSGLCLLRLCHEGNLLRLFFDVNISIKPTTLTTSGSLLYARCMILQWTHLIVETFDRHNMIDEGN